MLTLTRGAYDSLINRALAGRPREVCGVLGGERGGRVDTVRPVDNVAAHPRTAYRLDPAGHLAAMDEVERDGESEVVGFYHSHPRGPPEPSPTDVERAGWPGRVYVIVDLGGEHPYVGAWRWTGDRFDREAVALSDGD